ncbi:heptaprenyl diphosphate synthase component 2 [Lachnospiraceae bacterium]|nr:heptaprenyl diphosphate synthase component 2 [Lachnospiraceae bacterium]
MHNYEAIEITSFDYIASVAVSLEAIHKASVIIDDVIDGDSKRRGVDCFHVEFSEKEATFFAVCLLSGAIKNINEILSKAVSNQIIIKKSINLLCDTITNMCIGAINEIQIGVNDRCNIDKINQIINSETVALLKNSFLIGYMSSDGYNNTLLNKFTNIGMKCGYIFQVMNDLEPFCNPQYILSHKGNLNSDCLRSRKNIVIPYLFSNATKKDQTLLKSLMDTEGNYSILKNLFDKYHIRDIIFSDMNELRSAIYSTINSIQTDTVNINWLEVFPIFVDNLIEYCISVLDGTPKKW